jgi:hypothetical protein
MTILVAGSDLKLMLSKGDGLGPWTPSAIAHPYVGQGQASLRNWLVGESVYPTFSVHTTDTSATTTSVSAAIGSPANGDVVVIVHRAANITTLSFPGGWTVPQGGKVDDAVDSTISAYRVCDGSEGATVTITQGTSLRAITQAFKFTGAGTPIYAHYANIGAQVGTEAVQNDPLTGGPQPGIRNLFLVTATWTGGQETVTAAPSGYVGFTDVVNTGAGGAGSAHISYAYKYEVSNYDAPGVWSITDVGAGGVDTVCYGYVIPPA